MKKLLLILAITSLVTLFAWNCEHKTEATAGSTSIYNSFCDSSSAGSPCSFIPYDVNETFSLGYDSFLDSAHQIPFDVFSWQTFIALNWPSDSAGRPTGGLSDLPAAPRVWEYYEDPAEVFGHPDVSIADHLQRARNRGEIFLYMDSKAPGRVLKGNVVDMGNFHSNKLQSFQEADGHPLIDRNLNFALYQIKMNPIESKFVINNNLTTTQGIYLYGIKHGNAIQLPASDTATKNIGSMEIKASWRILIPSLGDDTSRYYCRKATVYIDSAHTRNHQALILTNVQVGLVGMHIIRKTGKVSTNEIWTTFEHIDNTPDNTTEAQQAGKKWSFYNSECLNCTPNAAPDTFAGDNGQYIWNTTMPYAAAYAVKAPGQNLRDSFGTQAMRVYPIYKYTQMVNDLWQQKLKGTVWANYRLIGSQWRQAEINPSPTAPNFLANTTLETFIQKDASCISCHNFATVAYNTDTISTNLSFLFPVYAQDSLLKKKK